MRSLLFLAALLLTGTVMAQIDLSNEWPPCTAEEIATIQDVTENFFADAVEILADYSNAGSIDSAQFIDDAEAFQQTWWNVTVPMLPECSYAVQVQLLVGRLADELLIGSLYYGTGDFEPMQTHFELVISLLNTIAPAAPASAPTAAPALSPTTEPVTYYIDSPQSVNIRSCPGTNCEVVERLSHGDEIQVFGAVTGQTISGNNVWYHITLDGEDGYVHHSLISTSPPVPITNNNAAPTSRPAPDIQEAPTSVPPPAQPTDVPIQPTEPPPISTPVPPPPPQGASCGGAQTCGQMSSCAQALACLAEGNTQLDRDGDGVPCESICG